tara:strand:- start:835 stop:2385 length:1551 start_codon:yes stop_codon:yes gene_type:complete
MAKIPIWPGSSSFSTHANPTAFGFYDSDADFAADADNVAQWCVQRLGYPLVDIELQDINLFSAFEEAVSEYGHQVYTFQIINNLFRIKGTATGSALNQILISADYGNNTGNINQGSGLSYNLTDQRLYSASLEVKRGKQKYNLLSSSPGFATTEITFTTTASVSSSITLTDTPGASIAFEAHASSSDYVVSGSQFETGSTNTETALNFQQAVVSSSLLIDATVSESVVSLAQRIEGTDGNTEITVFTSSGFEVTSSAFTGGSTGLSFEQSGSAIQAGQKQIKIKKIYHYAPAAINRYFDPYAGTGTGIQSLMQTFGFGNYSPGVNFMLMPIYFDTLKIQAIELNDTIRKSAYHFELNSGKFLKLFPIPTSDYKLWFEYTMADSSISAATEETDPDEDKPTNTITDISNAPYEKPVYAFINEPGRQWIRKYTLALAKEMLGSIRGKYQTLPIPGSDTTLDYNRLLSEAAAEKEALVTVLREDLEATTTLKQAERSTAESEQTQAQYTVDNPYQIYIH